VYVKNGQWASSLVEVSSQPAGAAYDGYASQALGTPNTYVYGDTAEAWTPAATGEQSITVGFSSPAVATGVLIRQANGNGFITKIEVIDIYDSEDVVWESDDETPTGDVRHFLATFTATAEAIKAVRITLSGDSGAAIDAVKLLTSTTVADPSAPDANNDTASATQYVSVYIDVLANDTLTSGVVTTIQITAAPTHGTLWIDAQGTPSDPSDDLIQYTPTDGENDSFTYALVDIYGQSSSATVTITVTAVNTAPVAGTDWAVTVLEEAVVIDLLANDSDADDDELSIDSVTQGAHGTVVDNEDGTVTYTPETDYVGVDGFTYVLSDGQGNTTYGYVHVIVYGPGQWAETVSGFSSQGADGWGEAASVEGAGDSFVPVSVR